MAKQSIGIGTVANDGTGDRLRTAMDKVNDNFDELYADKNPDAVAENDFIVADASLAWVKKTLAQVLTILGIPAATAIEDFIVASGAGTWAKKTVAETRAILTDGFVTHSDNYNSNQTVDVSGHKDHLYYYITGSMAFNLSGAVDGDAGMLIFIIDGTGGYTVTLGAAFTVKLGSTDIVATANKKNVISWRAVGSDIYYTIIQSS